MSAEDAAGRPCTAHGESVENPQQLESPPGLSPSNSQRGDAAEDPPPPADPGQRPRSAPPRGTPPRRGRRTPAPLNTILTGGAPAIATTPALLPVGSSWSALGDAGSAMLLQEGSTSGSSDSPEPDAPPVAMPDGLLVSCPSFASLETVSTASCKVLTPTHNQRRSEHPAAAAAVPAAAPPSAHGPPPPPPQQQQQQQQLQNSPPLERASAPRPPLERPGPRRSSRRSSRGATPPGIPSPATPQCASGVSSAVGSAAAETDGGLQRSSLEDISPRPLCPSSLNPFKHKVSGHHLMFRTSDGKIAKESSYTEERFYTMMRQSRRRCPEVQQFKSFIAEFEGIGYVSQRDLELLLRPSSGLGGGGEAATPSAAGHSPTQVKSPLQNGRYQSAAPSHAATPETPAPPAGALPQPPPQSQDRKFILLRDLTYGFQRPCIVDMKMGVRNYGLGCSQSKRASKKRKTQETTSATLGIRVHGMKKWNPRTEEFVSMDKHKGRGLRLDTLQQSMREFFAGEGGVLVREALMRIIARLEALCRLFERQELFHFYTSSLLLFYDMAAPERTADLCMIDFAYTYPVSEVLRAEPKKMIPRRDEGYLLGLRNLHRLLAAVLCGEPFVSVPPTITASGRCAVREVLVAGGVAAVAAAVCCCPSPTPQPSPAALPSPSAAPPGGPGAPDAGPPCSRR